jgi:hypothetical protein
MRACRLGSPLVGGRSTKLLASTTWLVSEPPVLTMVNLARSIACGTPSAGRRYRTQGRSLLRSDPFLQTLWSNPLLESQFLTVIEVDCDLPQVFWTRPAPTVP